MIKYKYVDINKIDAQAWEKTTEIQMNAETIIHLIWMNNCRLRGSGTAATQTTKSCSSDNLFESLHQSKEMNRQHLVF